MTTKLTIDGQEIKPISTAFMDGNKPKRHTSVPTEDGVYVACSSDEGSWIISAIHIQGDSVAVIGSASTFTRAGYAACTPFKEFYGPLMPWHFSGNSQ